MTTLADPLSICLRNALVRAIYAYQGHAQHCTAKFKSLNFYAAIEILNRLGGLGSKW